MVHEKNWRVNLRVQELHHPPKFSLNSCSHSGISEYNGSHRSFNNGSPDLSSTVVDTVTGEMSPSIRSSRSRVLVSLTVGEEDELEEDVEQRLSCLESVLEVDGSDPEDELADKPGTTMGMKFSVLHCIRIPFSMRCGF